MQRQAIAATERVKDEQNYWSARIAGWTVVLLCVAALFLASMFIGGALSIPSKTRPQTVILFSEQPWEYVVQMGFYLMVYFCSVLVLARCPGYIVGVKSLAPTRRTRMTLLGAAAILITGSVLLNWAGRHWEGREGIPTASELETRRSAQMLADLARMTWLNDGECPASADRLLEMTPNKPVRNGASRLYFGDAWGRPLHYEPFNPALGYGRVWSEGKPGGKANRVIEVRFGDPASE